MARDYVESEIPSVYNLQEVPPRREEPGLTQTIFRGVDQMVGFNLIDPEKEDGAPHSHPWEQINFVADGQVDFVVGDERVTLEQYDVLEIPPDIEHASRADPDESAVLLAFWPVREEFQSATEYQTEFQTD